MSVRQLLDLLAEYSDWDELRSDYPELEPEDIPEALRFAAASLDERYRLGLPGTPAA